MFLSASAAPYFVKKRFGLKSNVVNFEWDFAGIQFYKPLVCSLHPTDAVFLVKPPFLKDFSMPLSFLKPYSMFLVFTSPGRASYETCIPAFLNVDLFERNAVFVQRCCSRARWELV